MLDKIRIDLAVQLGQQLLVAGRRRPLLPPHRLDDRRNDVLPKVLVHEPRARQLGRVALPERVREPALVVVEPQPLWVVLRANVHHDLTLRELGRVARPDDHGVAVLRQQAEQRDGQRLVAVEVPVVRADQHAAAWARRSGHVGQDGRRRHRLQARPLVVGRGLLRRHGYDE